MTVLQPVPVRATLTVFDLEFTAWECSMASHWLRPGEFKEVVQIGALKLDALSFTVLEELDLLVRPRINPQLSAYFENLTGITNTQVAARGVDFAQGYARFSAFAAGGPICAFGHDEWVLEENIRLYDLKKMPALPEFFDLRAWFAVAQDRSSGACCPARSVRRWGCRSRAGCTMRWTMPAPWPPRCRRWWRGGALTADASRRVSAEADLLIAQLGLQPHPEGGHFRETFRDDTDAGRASSTAIYFLLKAGEVSRWHRVDAAEVWHYYRGAPLELTIGKAVTILGPEIEHGQVPQAVVPAGAWQAARSLGDYTLVGCTVAPGFEFAGFEMASEDFEP